MIGTGVDGGLGSSSGLDSGHETCGQAQKVAVGLVGFGMGGSVFHAPIISSVEGLLLKKIAARRPEQIAQIHDRYPLVEIVDDLEGLISDSSIDLIVIATQNTEHYNLALRAIQAGKHVVVEKPFTVTRREAHLLIEAAEHHGVILSVHHNRRFDADFLTLQKLISEGRLGEVITYESRFNRFRKTLKENSWREAQRPGSGLTYDLGSHLIDQALVLFGDPEYVTGHMAAQRSGAVVDDFFEILLDYADKRVVLTAGNMVRDFGLRYTVNGTEGSFIKSGMDVQEEKLKQGYFPKDDSRWGIEPESQYGHLLYESEGLSQDEMITSEEGDYRRYYDDLKNAILQKRAPYVTGLDGYKVIKIIELALQSHDEKRSLKFKD